MRLPGIGAAPAALVVLLAAHPVRAQSTTTWLGAAGISFPAGVLNVYADHGWDLTAGVERTLGTHPVALRLDLSYSRNTDITGIGFHEATAFTAVMANVVYHFQGARPHLYAMAGIGYIGRRFSTDDPDDPAFTDVLFGFQVGEGVTFRVRSATLFLEARFVSAGGQQPPQFIPLVLGVRLGAGKQ